MQETLFNPPIWLPIVLAIVGVVVFAYGNARVQAAVRNAGAAFVGLVLLWSAAAYFVRTPTEQCLDRTRGIIALVEAGKWEELKPLLDTNTSLLVLRGRDQIVSVAQSNAENFGLKDISILSENIERGPDTVDITINTLIEAQYSSMSVWKFEYERRSDGMLLSRITPVSVAGASADEIRGRVNR